MEIEKIEKDVLNKTEEIERLKKKEKLYDEEIASLKSEYNLSKKKVIDEGHALGLAETMLREFR